MKKPTDEEFLKKEFNFSKARRVTPTEHARFVTASNNPPVLRGRPRKRPEEKFLPVTIRLDPRIVVWAKREAKRQHVGYQTILNQELLRRATALNGSS